MVLVIGGDHLGAIAGNLESLGLGGVHHIKGRTEQRVAIPAGTRLVVVLVDYVNHNLSRWVKGEARTRNLPIVFSRRSWSAICQSLAACQTCDGVAGCAGSLARGEAAG